MKKLLIFFIISPVLLLAQTDSSADVNFFRKVKLYFKDTSQKPHYTYLTQMPKYKNTIRYNMSNTWFFGTENRVFGYERVVKPYQSFSVNIGLASFPKLGSASFDSVEYESGTSGSGFNMAVDYRFYLKKENRHGAPRGIYLAPFFSYTYMQRTNRLKITPNVGPDISTEFDNKFTALIGGGALGYQFLFWKDRIALDLVLLGPGIGFYRYQGKFSTNLTPDEGKEIKEALKDYLLENYPGIEGLLGGRDFDLERSGYSSTFAYRYVMHIGYRF
jgi:hypothetical protein